MAAHSLTRAPQDVWALPAWGPVDPCPWDEPLASHTACFNGQLSSESGLHAQLFLEMPAPAFSEFAPLLRAGNVRAPSDLVGAGYGPNSGWL